MIDATAEEIHDSREKTAEMSAKGLALTEEERMHIHDMGFYNNVTKGFLIQAMSFEGFSDEDIKRALNGMKTALGCMTAKQALELYRKF